MLSRTKKILVGAFCTLILASAVAFAVSVYNNALVTFSGIDLVTNAVSADTQGFIDISMKEINATGLTFCIKYNPDVFKLSDVTTNTPIVNPPNTNPDSAALNLEHKFFEQNTADFPDGSFLDEEPIPGVDVINWHIIGTADATEGCLIMTFLPDENNLGGSPYLGMITENGKTLPGILANTSTGVKLGRLSLKIVDPIAFSKMTPAQINDSFKIISFSQMPGVQTESYEYGLYMTYLDQDGKIQRYTNAAKNIKYEFDIKAKLNDVRPQVEELDVSSYEIYKTGTPQDLYDFINEKMCMLTLTYADNSKVPEVFNWDITNSTLGGTWDTKGGTYTVTQRYNNDFDVTVKVNVKPVNLISFDFDNSDLTFAGNDPDFPTTLEELKLPTQVRPVFDTYLPNGGIQKVNIDNYIYSGGPLATAMPTDFHAANPGDFTFSGYCGVFDFASMNFPWLTVPNPLPDITVMRHIILNTADLPSTLNAVGSVYDNGVLTITVTKSDGAAFDQTAPGTKFKLKMPGGEVIDIDSLTAKNIVDNGTAGVTITIDPDMSNSAEKKLAQLVNLGNRAGGFAVAATEPGKNITPYADFTFNPRKNIYTGTSADYVFDYSGARTAMMPVKAGKSLPTTIVLPDYRETSAVSPSPSPAVMPTEGPVKKVKTTYNGYDGSEEGELTTVTVDSWTVVSGNPNISENVVEVTGRLSDTSYTNYGQVYNDNNVYITIRYYTIIDDSNNDAIADIADFDYNIQQVGYDYNKLQTHSFTVTNTGNTNINGLGAAISIASKTVDGSPDGTAEAFVLTKDLPIILESGKSVDFDITTRIGLPVGKYVSTVTLFSDNKSPLDTFNISFEVIAEPVCSIKIMVSDAQKTFGTVGDNKQQTETYTARADNIETVTLKAVPEEDCKFTGWTIKKSSGVFQLTQTQAQTTPLTITIPNGETDIELYANFEETLGAKLRATDLIVYDETLTAQKLYNSQWTQVTYDPATREYYLAVSNSVNEVQLWFKPRTEVQNGDFSVTYEYINPNASPAPASTAAPSTPAPGATAAPGSAIMTSPRPMQDSNDLYYKSQFIPLTVSPTENLVKLIMTYDDPYDNDGEYTREYKLHIYKKVKNLITFNCGNSPFGLIMRDSSITDKNGAKTAFINNDHTFPTATFTPNGATAGTAYSTLAWRENGTTGGINYDEDDSALFVIRSDPFEDSGYSEITNSIGGEVTSLEKSVKVDVLQYTAAADQTGSSDDYNFTSSETITLPASGSITELQGKRIRPGIYELEYKFKDFDGTNVTLKKPMIILSALGDVNATGDVNETDSDRVIGRFALGLDLTNQYNLPGYTAGGRLNKYRICDVNKDGNLNAIDANYIRDKDNNPIIPYYINLSGGGN